MAGLWGLGITLFWWSYALPRGGLREPLFLGLTLTMALVSLISLVEALLSARQESRRGVALPWVGALAALLLVGATIGGWGVLYVPTVVLLFIAAVLAILRHPPSRIGIWLELGLGGLGSALGMATTGFWLTSGVAAVLPQVASRVLFGTFALAALLGFALHTWLGSRLALALIWTSAGGLLMGSVVGFAIGGTSYLPAAFLVMAGCVAATMRSPSKV